MRDCRWWSMTTVCRRVLLPEVALRAMAMLRIAEKQILRYAQNDNVWDSTLLNGRGEN